MLVLLLSSQITRAQNQVLDFFDLEEVSNGIQVRWAISGGEQCNGVRVLRSEDQINFSEIGGIDGICGGNEFPTPYQFKDSILPINTELYYYLKLGNQGFSDTLAAIFYSPAELVQIYPHPIEEQSRMVLPKNLEFPLVMRVFNMGGQLVAELNVQREVFFRELNLPAGRFHFELEGSGGFSKKGTFSVL
ncbi:MAG: hypothetical protein ACJAY8_001354 [Sphingobacteriales bacterium]|jgi:hypothetical protein